MKMIILATSLLFGQFAFAGSPPAGFPTVNGVIKKIDPAGARVSLKHDAIPNLSMPGMTMSFAVKNPNELSGLAVGDKVQFSADEIDGELTAIWIEKAPAAAIASAGLFCKGMAPTSPRTNIELEIRKDKFSTIRYEFAEGSYMGTAHVNSIGRMELAKQDDLYVYSSGGGLLDSRLEFTMKDGLIAEARFSNFSSGMQDTLVDCVVAD